MTYFSYKNEFLGLLAIYVETRGKKKGNLFTKILGYQKNA
tara:strand:- start:5300 stop:5419 length:120 start_codon:yes stop_codon:yes gene_type:complete